MKELDVDFADSNLAKMLRRPGHLDRGDRVCLACPAADLKIVCTNVDDVQTPL